MNEEDLKSQQEQPAEAEGPAAGNGDGRLEEAERERDQFKRLAQRAQADLINYRRRVELESSEAQARAARRVALRMMDVIDQLDVALAPEAAEGVDSKWVEGVRAIHRNFLHALAQEGFERFEAAGETFDPNRHEALVSTPTTEFAPGTIIRQMVAGYTHKSEVVRPAKVEIAAPPPDDATDEGD